VVTIDDNFVYDATGSNLFNEPGLLYAKIGLVNNAAWAPLVEKAFAKVRGNFFNAGQGGTTVNGIKMLTGIPVFSYDLEDMEVANDARWVWDMLKTSDDLNYIMGSGTSTSAGDYTYNSCDIPN
jgi:hypothetical protein